MLDLLLVFLLYFLSSFIWKSRLFAVVPLLLGSAIAVRFSTGLWLEQADQWWTWDYLGLGADASATLQIVSLSSTLFVINLVMFIGIYPSFRRSRTISHITSEQGRDDHALSTSSPHLSTDYNLILACLPLSFLMFLLCINVHFFGDNTLGGANQWALLMAAGMALIIGKLNGYNFSDQFEGVKNAIADTSEALMILLMIGALAGTWMLCGIVPAMIDYGLSFMSPSYFLFASCILCAIVSLASGSSWSTVATVGVALVGIGHALGFSVGLCAGAIISGAYFGDKLSPLSDTTNLAPAMAGGSLFPHIRAMLWTTVPSITITLLIFLLIGLGSDHSYSIDRVQSLQQQLRSIIWIHPILMIIPLLLLVLIIKKTPALPALGLATLAAALLAIWAQPQLIQKISGEALSFKSIWITVTNALTTHVKIPSPDPMLADLLQSKGMKGMLGTIWLIMCALTFGGVMEKNQSLAHISQSLLRLVSTRKGLVSSTCASCVFLNVTASDQYLAIVVPGRMYRQAFADQGLAPEALSRTLEDGATVTSVLIPWNTCGATQAGVLGVATIAYAPFCFFNWISPLMTILFAYMGWKQPLLATKPLSTPIDHITHTDNS
jgi:Na+:H+ antiporter, NhaC family